MRPRWRFVNSFVSVGALALAGAGIVALPAAAQDEPGETVDLYGINDFHGRISPDGQSAGAASLAGALDQFRADNPNSLFVSAGDDIGASTFTSFIQDDEPTIEALTAAGLAVSGAGNHEFDRGFDDLANRVRGLAGYDILSANLFEAGTDNHALDPYVIETVGEFDIAFVGAVTEDLPSLVSPSGIEDIEVRDIPESVNAAVAEIGDTADAVVLLLHEGATGTSEEAVTSGELGRILDGVGDNVDAVFTGHTHLQYNHDLAGYGDLPLPVVQTGQYGYNLGKVSLTFDDAGELTGASSEIIPLTEQDAEGNWATIYDPNSAVADIVERAEEAAEELGAEPVGNISTDFNRAVQSDGTENRGGESTIGNLIADVQLDAVQVTDDATQIAFMNPGGIRTDLEYGDDGVVTFREVAEVQPFANTLVTLTLTGEQVVQVLEEQWQPDGASRPFLKLGVAGLTYTYNPTAGVGEHITDVTLDDGSALDPAGQYRVVANSFLASGGDNFTTLAEGSDSRDTGQIDLEAMVNFFDAAQEPVGPDRTQRAVGVTMNTTGPYGPGDDVAFDLSSLLFTDDDLADPTAEVSLDGAVLGSFSIDSTIVDTTDEVGRASVSVTVPDDVEAEGDAELVVTVSETGTQMSVPIVLGAGDPGDDTGADTGKDDGTEDGKEVGTDQGTDKGTEVGTDKGTDDGTETGTDDGKELPDTGSNTGLWIIAAVVVLAIGGGLYAWSRRRSSDATAAPPTE